MDEKIRIALGQSEALVLFDLLSREFDVPDYGKFREVSVSAANIWALDGVLAALQKTLVVQFANNYDEQIREAGAELVQRRGPLPVVKV